MPSFSLGFISSAYSPTYIAIGSIGVYAYRWGDGFMSRYTDPFQQITGALVQRVEISPAENAIAATDSGKNLAVFSWNSNSGFGSRYSTLSGGTSGVQSMAFTPEADAVVMSSSTSGGFLYAGSWSSSGWGTRYTNPTSILNSYSDIKFNKLPGRFFVAITTATSPYLDARKWDSSSGFGTKYANPSPTPSSGGYRVSISPDEQSVAMSQFNSPYISVYRFSSGGFGTKYSNPSVLATSGGDGISFSPDNSSIVMALAQSPYLAAWAWNSTSGFGTKYADPATPLSDNSAFSITFSKSGADVFIGQNYSGTATYGFSAYKWSNGFGTKYADPSNGLFDMVSDISYM